MAELGKARLTLGSLLDLKPGDIIPCDFNGQASVLADQVPLFAGELGQSRGRQVVRVNQLNIRKSGNALDVFARRA